MLGRGLVKTIVAKLVAGAVAAGCALVAVVALGVTIYHLLLMVFIPAAAGAITAGLFLIAAAGVALRFLGKAQGDSEPHEDDDLDDADDDGGLLSRAVHLAAARPVLGGAAALATAFLFLRNPALATLAAALFGETERQRKRRKREERRR